MGKLYVKIVQPAIAVYIYIGHMIHYDVMTVLLQVPKTDDGLEALVFTAQGDMRQALNNLQSTFDGFGFVNADNVFKVTVLYLLVAMATTSVYYCGH